MPAPSDASPTADPPAALRAFAVTAGEALVSATEALRQAIAAGAEPRGLRDHARQVGTAWVETLLAGFVLPVAAATRGPGAGQRTATMIRDLAETVVASGARTSDLAHARDFLAFLDAHLTAAPPRIRFAIDDALAATLVPALRPDPPPAVLATAMHTVVDVTLRQFLDQPLALIGLGLVTRTAIKVGRLAIARRVRAEVDRAVADPAARARVQTALRTFVVA